MIELTFLTDASYDILFLGECTELKLVFGLERLHGCLLGKGLPSLSSQAPGPQRDAHCCLFSITGGQWTAEMKTCVHQRGWRENHLHPNTRPPSTLHVKSMGPVHAGLVTALREQLHLWMLSHSDTYCSIKQFLAMP